MKTIKKTLLVVAGAAFVWLAWKAPAQDTASFAAPPQISYGAQQVLKLEQAKVGDATVIAYINNSQTSYGLDASQIIYLRQQGVSDAVLTAMLTQSRAGVAPADAPQAVPMSPPPADATAMADQPVVATATPPPAVTYVQTAPTVDYSYYDSGTYYPNYAYFGWPWVWWGGGWGWHGGGWGGGWHGGAWHGGGWGGGWHGGGSWHGGGGGGFHFGGGHGGGGGHH